VKVRNGIPVPNGLLNELNSLRANTAGEKHQTVETSMASQWNRRGRHLRFETTESLNIQLLVNSIPALIHTGRPDGYLDYFNKPCLVSTKISGQTV
jgi:hypothetical protein